MANRSLPFETREGSHDGAMRAIRTNTYGCPVEYVWMGRVPRCDSRRFVTGFNRFPAFSDRDVQARAGTPINHSVTS